MCEFFLDDPELYLKQHTYQIETPYTLETSKWTHYFHLVTFNTIYNRNNRFLKGSIGLSRLTN